MDRREWVKSALQHKETSNIPWHIDFTTQALEQYIVYTADENVIDTIGTYLHYAQYDAWPTEISDKSGFFRDEFGVVWNRNGADKDIGVVNEPLIADFENYEYQFPKSDIIRIRKDIEKVIDTREDRFAMYAFGFCMFERSWSLAGMENVLIAMVAYPDALHDLYDRICEHYLPLIDIALEYSEIDGILFGDDWGQQKGLIMGASHWREFIKPRMRRLYARVKNKGKYVLQHSCGDCSEILPDLIEIGLDCYQTFQPEIYDIRFIKEKYGDRLSIWGGISTQQALPTLTAQELQDEIVRIGKIMRKNGGYIMAPTHALTDDIPPENIQAMLEVFQHQEKFFI